MRSSILNKHVVGFLFGLTGFLIISCSPSVIPQTQDADIAVQTPVSWFHSDSTQYLFNTKIDVLKNHFSGLLVFRNMGGDTFRVVLITEVGLKIMDLEFSPEGETKVWYIMEAMNKKALIRTLSNDLNLLIMPFLKTGVAESRIDEDLSSSVFKYKVGSRKNFVSVTKDHPFPVEIRQAGWINNKVKATFYGKPESGPDSIRLAHYHFKLRMNLYRIIE
jgi:hypothetical protein